MQVIPREFRNDNNSGDRKGFSVVVVVEAAIVVVVVVVVVVVLLGVVEVEIPHAASNAVAEIAMIESFFTLNVLCCCRIYLHVSFLALGNKTHSGQG
jgi:hypothetical protein